MTSILGIASHYHDSAAAILVNGTVIAAAQEERFSRIKHDASLPCQAIEFCLREAGILKSQIDYVAYYEKPIAKFERLLETYLEFAPFGYPFFRQSIPVWTQSKLHIQKAIRKALNGEYRKRIAFIEHHQSHAATAFYNSPFEQSAILTIDGVGEWTTTAIGLGNRNRISLIDELKFPHSIGLLYSAFTSYLGFRVNDGEYKVMGLASYGSPDFLREILNELIDWREDGSFRLNMKYFHFCHGASMTNSAFDQMFGGPRRRWGDPMTDRHRNIAASIQVALEEMILRIARTTYSRTGCNNLVMAGGVALNCVANSRVAKEGPFDHVWVHGAAGDCGGAIGAAQFVWHQLLEQPRSVKAITRTISSQTESAHELLIGPSFDDEEIANALDAAGLQYQAFESDETLCEAVAEQIDAQKVVGWFQGRMEFGPRALGCRSILADARNPAMKERLNMHIKHRESFRPFAPAILAEFALEYFEITSESDCSSMTFIVDAKSDADTECEFPSVVHVDGTARLQAVSEANNPSFHRLLHAFYKKTKCPLLINTSFNLRDEPIVCTPEDAIRCFHTTQLDALCIGRFLVIREQQNQTQVMPCSVEQHEDQVSQKFEGWGAKIFAGLGRLAFLPMRVVAEAAMLAAYFGVFLPVALIRRHWSRVGNSAFRIDKDCETYWSSREEVTDFKSFFRQT